MYILIVIALFLIISLTFKLLKKNIHNDKKKLIKYLTKRNSFLEISFSNANENLKDDEDVVRIAVRKSIYNFEYASVRIRRNEKFILELIEINPHIIQYSILKTDKICNKALKIDGAVLPFCSSKYQSKKDIIIDALTNINPIYYHWKNILENINDELKDDKDLINYAVTKNPKSFKSASERLKKDREIVENTLRNDSSMIEYISDSLKDDKEIVKLALSKNNKQKDRSSGLLEFASERLKNDKELALFAINSDHNNFKYLTENLKDDKEVAFAAVKGNGLNLKYASYRLRKDFDVALTAVKNNSASFEFVLESLKNDIDFVLESIKKDPSIKKYLNDSMLKHPSVRKALPNS
jgi:hypothetical protein